MSYDPIAFGMQSRQAGGNCLVMELAGEIDLANAPLVREALLRTLNTHNGALVVDLTDVCFIDSAGLNALVSGYRRAKQLERSYALSNPQPGTRRLLELTALDSLIPIYGTTAEACANDPTPTAGRQLV